MLRMIINAIRCAVAMFLHPENPAPPIPETMTPDEVKRALTALALAPDVADASNWDESIVDLLKVLHMDSSSRGRTLLAKELGYTGNAPMGSAEMNEWLHVEVMRKFAEHCYAP